MSNPFKEKVCFMKLYTPGALDAQTRTQTNKVTGIGLYTLLQVNIVCLFDLTQFSTMVNVISQ